MVTIRLHNTRTRAKEIFTKAGAHDICATNEASTPKDSRAGHRPAHPVVSGLSPVGA